MLTRMSISGKPYSQAVLCMRSYPSRTNFLHRLLDTAHSVHDLETQLHIDHEALFDIEWWSRFSVNWNGKALFLEARWTPAHHLQLYTDASSTIGFGAYCNGAWFSQPCPQQPINNSIEWKELYAIVMACEVWGPQWRG